MPYFYSTCVCVLSSHLNWKEIWSRITKATFLSEECKPQVQQEERTSVYCKKNLRLRIIYYLHGGKIICINVVELAQCDDDWQRNRTHRRGMRDYWEAVLCFGKYWCFPQEEISLSWEETAAHLSVPHWLQKPQRACAQLFTPALQNNRMMSLGSTLSALTAEAATMSAVSSNDHK